MVPTSLKSAQVAEQASGSDATAAAGPAPRDAVTRLAASPAVHAAFSWLQKHERKLAELQMEIARVPAPPFAETRRSQWLGERFRELGLEDVQVDGLGNVFAVRRGTDASARFVALTAHLDTVFPEGTPLEVRREGSRLYGPGISDNAAGLAALLAIASALEAGRVKHAAPLLFIANVGEEGEGDLRGMRHIFNDPRWRDRIAYTIVVDGSGTDTIVAQALGSRRFQVTVRGPGGHSWSDFGVANPINALARAVERLTRISLPSSPKTTLNVGVISGGTSVNSIPESASMRVDIRSAAPEQIARLERALRDAVASAVAAEQQKSRGKGRLNFEIEQIGDRPAAELDPDSRILEVVRAVDAHLGNHARVQRASTDANVPLALGLEAVALGSGGSGGNAHSLSEWYDISGRDLGLKRILLVALALAGAAP